MKSSSSKIEWPVAEIKLRYTSNAKNSERPQIITSEDAYKIFIQTWDREQIDLFEQFKVILLNSANKVLGICTISAGGISEMIVDVRLVFAIALKGRATALIVAHNHPSGTLSASSEDKRLTRKLREIGKLLNVPLYDHLILTGEDYFSFADQGLLENSSTRLFDNITSKTSPDKKKEIEGSSCPISLTVPSDYQNL